jgi:hypothetical protein
MRGHSFLPSGLLRKTHWWLPRPEIQGTILGELRWPVILPNRKPRGCPYSRAPSIIIRAGVAHYDRSGRVPTLCQ